MVVRQRKTREARYDGAGGTVGRMTGLPMPKNVPITDEGYEDFEAFFSGNGGDAGPSRSAAKSSKSNKGSAAAAGPTAAADLLSKAARREARSKQDTNVFAPNFELGAVGRRTGIKIRNDVPRTQEGYEDFEAFFKSPTGATGHKSKRSSRPSVRTSAASSIGVGRRASTATDVDKSAWSVANGHEDDEDEDSEQDEDTRDHIVPVPLDDFEFEAGADAPENDYSDDQQQQHEPDRSSSPQQPPQDDTDEEERDQVHNLPALSNRYGNDDDSDNEDEPPEPVMMSPDPGDADAAASPSPHSRASEAAQGKKTKRKSNQDRSNDHDSPRKASGKSKKQRRTESEDPPEGVRRSNRPHIRPLEYWRNERIVYNRRKSGVVPSWGIKEILRQPPQEHKSLSARNRKGGKKGGNKRDKSETPLGADHPPAAAAAVNEYEGWDDTTDPNGLTWDYVSQEERHRRVAFTSKMVNTKEAGKHAYRFQKVFTDGDYVACGLLEIPPNEKKPLKPSKDNTFMLFVHQGAVRVLVYRTTFTIATGGFALVPRGNSYEIENIGVDDAKVVFMQAREVRVVDDPSADAAES